jgi:polysaccharide biosynthesis protein PslG
MRPWQRLLAACGLAVAVVGAAVAHFGGGPAPAPARLPSFPPLPASASFIGMTSGDVFGAGEDYRARMLALERRSGVGLLRQTFAWSLIERSPSRYDFKRYDRFIADTSRAGIRILGLLFDPPPFRSSRPRHGARHGTYPPASNEQFGRFAAAVVARYGPRGSFWRDNPELPKLPIRDWQVWNEPSLPAYWPAGPDPAAYARMLATVARAIKGADPGADVVSAGIPQTSIGMPFARFVNGMLAAGAGSSLDTFAIHAFARGVPGVVGAVQDARRLLRRHGSSAPVWITELGWASNGPASDFTVGYEGQSRRVAGVLETLSARRRALGLRGIVYYNWRDGTPGPGRQDYWGFHTGLLDAGGHAKPALYAFRRAAERVVARGAG